MKIDKETDALLIVDVQNDFCPGGTLAVSFGDAVVPAINRISMLFRHVAATQDWHPEGHVSFASAHSGKKPYDSVIVKGETQALWPDHCVQGTRGADFQPGLDARPVGIIVRKGRNAGLDSYSAFFENDRKTKTGLGDYFKGLVVRRIFVCGLATDYCVKWSVLDALSLGFQAICLRDAMRGVDFPPGTSGAAEKEMAGAGAAFIESSDLNR